MDFYEVEGATRGRIAIHRRSGKEQFIQSAVVTILRQRPTQTRCYSSFQVPMDAGLADGATTRDLVLEQASNPASRLGRFTRTAKSTEKKGVSLTTEEVQTFLDAASEICPDYYPLFLTALRAGLRRGELVALRIGDLNFGKDENDQNRYIFVQHNYVHREHTSTKSKKARRVDMSRDLRRALIALRDERLLKAFMKGMNDISDELVFPSPEGGILDPDNLYHRYFLPVLAKAGIRKIRLHDLRHTFGSLLIQAGASIVYVKEQMGHSSIQVTVDIYGHLIPGANVSYVDRLDARRTETPQKSANRTQTLDHEIEQMPAEVVDLIGGGGWTRTSDLRIMRPSL